MPDIDLVNINRRILTITQRACNNDIAKACIVYSVHLNVAEAIKNISLDTIDFIAEHSVILLHPAMIPVETWLMLDKMHDDAKAAMQVVHSINNFPNAK